MTVYPQPTACPECGGPVFSPFTIGRTQHAVCTDCGYCVTHANRWPSFQCDVAKTKEAA